MLAGVLAAGGCVPAARAPDRGELVRCIVTSTVQLRSQREGGIRRAASGVVVATDPGSRRAWVVTVRHFVTPFKPQQVSVQLPGQERAIPAGVMAVSAEDLDLDLAIIEVDNVDVTAVRFKEVTSLGDEVLIVAFPWGERFTVVRGIVSQVLSTSRASITTGPARMVDASVSYGSSGGGVFDARTGELVGIVETYRTAKVTIPEIKDRTIDIPVPGETTLVPAAVILNFVQEFGLGRRLAK